MPDSGSLGSSTVNEEGNLPGRLMSMDVPEAYKRGLVKIPLNDDARRRKNAEYKERRMQRKRAEREREAARRANISNDRIVEARKRLRQLNEEIKVKEHLKRLQITLIESLEDAEISVRKLADPEKGGEEEGHKFET